MAGSLACCWLIFIPGLAARLLPDLLTTHATSFADHTPLMMCPSRDGVRHLVSQPRYVVSTHPSGDSLRCTAATTFAVAAGHSRSEYRPPRSSRRPPEGMSTTTSGPTTATPDVVEGDDGWLAGAKAACRGNLPALPTAVMAGSLYRGLDLNGLPIDSWYSMWIWNQEIARVTELQEQRVKPY